MTRTGVTRTGMTVYCMTDLLRILGLWRSRAGWLVAGGLVSLAALTAGVGMMAIGEIGRAHV